MHCDLEAAHAAASHDDRIVGRELGDRDAKKILGSLPGRGCVEAERGCERVVEDVNMFLTKCAIGAAAAVPSSYMTGRFIAFKFNLNNNLARKYFSDGVAPTLGGIGRDKREVTLEVTMEGNAATITERDAYEAGTSRVVRITALGTTIAGSSPTHVRTVDLVVCGKWASFEVGERDTNTIFTGVLEAEYDATLTYEMSLTVDNLVTSFPP